MICLVWEWGIFGTLSLDFPVLAEEERLFGAPGPRRGFQVPGLRAGFGLGLRNRTLHSGLSDFMPEGGKQSTAWPRETPLTTLKGARQSGSN